MRLPCSLLIKSHCYRNVVLGKEATTIRFGNLIDFPVQANTLELTLYECTNISAFQPNNSLKALTVKFSKITEPERLWSKHLQSFEVVQCEVPILKIIKLKGLAELKRLSLVGLHMKQSHLKVLLAMESQVTMLDLSMNRELGDHGFLMLLQSPWIQRLTQLKMGGPDSGCSLTNHSIKLLLEHSSNVQGLYLLDLSWNHFDKEGYQLLAHCYEKVCSIYRIDLTRTGIDDPHPQLPNVLV